MATILSLVLGALAVFCLARLLQSGKRDPRMPPGPPTLPILGNLHQIPLTGLYKQFREWGKQYGGVYSLKFGSKNVIVLCDRKAVHDLIDKKGVLYADRPHSYVAQLLTEGDHMVVSPLDPLTATKRKVATHNLSPRIIDEKLAPIQESEMRQLMFDIMEQPDDLYRHVRRVTSSIACTFVFGQRAPTYDTFWGSCVYRALEVFGAALEPGANPPVDEFPFLRILPAFISPWKQRAFKSRALMDSIWSGARQKIEQRRATGEKRDCIADRLLDDYEANGSPFTQHAFDMLLGELVEGGAETTSSSVLTDLLALAINPWIQDKARLEIDAVCGTERSPTWSDFDKLPYINAIVKEGMRYRPVISSGLPRMNKQEDNYEGMLIPKGSMIFIPIWAIQHSEHLGFKDPEKFNPDRYIGFNKLANDYAGSPDFDKRDKGISHHYGYGAGRRMCPGIHLAERNQFRMLSKILWAFEITEPVDPATGKIIPLDPNAYEKGLLHAPLPFKASIKPRSQAHIDTIRREMAEARKSFTKWE